MGGLKGNWALFISTGISLAFGFATNEFWILGGLLGLVPAINWLVKDLRHHTMGSDVLAVFALIGALLTSELFAASVVAFMLATGRVLESWAEGHAERQLKSLLARVPRNTHRIRVDGSIEEIQIDVVQAGDRILIRGGEIIPTDGELLVAATLDESALTGEPLPVNREVGDLIDSGIINAGSPFEYLATNTSEASTYAAIIRLVKSARAKNSPGIRIANRWALRFVPISLILSIGSWIFSGDINRAIAVLVAATPCPLILAVPIAIVSGLSRSAKNGAVIKGGAILELLGRTEVVLLDKTGTLTHGGPVVGKIEFKSGYSAQEILMLAASVDQYSPHVVAKSLVSAARQKGIELKPVTEILEVAGHKIQGNFEGNLITVGQLVGERPEWLTIDFPLIVAVTKGVELIGAIGLRDPLRPESKKLIGDLKAAGVKYVALVTGDRESTAREVANEIGIENVYSEVTSEGKLEITRGLMSTSAGTVVVVGDGINDAPALAAAHVGVAMGARGASAASEAADVVIVEDSIDRLTIAINIAKTSRRKAIQAAGIGMALSFVAMIAGALGVMSPGQGAITQEIIDVVAILWALTALVD